MSLLLDAGIVFALLAVGAAVASRLDQSLIPAYILAGVALGSAPARVIGYQLPSFVTAEFVELLAELGIVLLLFFVGLEFNLERLLASRDRIVRAGTIDLVINGGLGLVVAFALGFDPLTSLFVAGIVYISSSAVITKSLVDLGWIANPESDPIIGTLVFEDVVIAVYLALLGALVGGGDLATTGGSLAIALGFIVVLVVIAAVGTDAVAALLDADSDELFLIRIIAAVAVVGGLALEAGVSEAVAAFFLGAAVGGTDLVERIERVVISERDLYAAVFFLSIGLQTDPDTLAAVAVPVAVLVAVTAPAKLVSGYASGRVYGLSAARSTRVGLALVARGEFSIVLAALALSAGLDPQLAALAVGYVLVMSTLGTLLMRYAAPFERLATRATA